jgi:ketopantoate hydroxymethyltransferase
MLDSIHNAETDYRAREAIELRNKAEAMVRGTQRAMAMADLPPDQTYAVNKALKALGKLLVQNAAATALKAGCDELTKVTATIADDVISAAVTKALRDEQGSR